MHTIRRVILIVLDSVGIGELPDAHVYGDVGSNTLGNIAQFYPALALPTLTALGLGNIDMDNRLAKTDAPMASFGKAAELSAGKDTTTGHWEICGVVLDKPFPTFLEGFPAAFIQQFEEAIGTKTIGNMAASGTEIINDLGDEHVKTGYPIVYTSADSVFQIAMHEAVYPIERQYDICEIARDLLKGEWEVGRVIARPFEGTSGNYKRTSRRKDFSRIPPETVLDAAEKVGLTVLGIGKIVDIFAGKGITHYVKTADNTEGVAATIEAIEHSDADIIFTNLVDFDMLYGHRRDTEGYAKALMSFDAAVPNILKALKTDDLLIITADHGNDPTFTGSDHTREYVPILNYGATVTAGYNIGVRHSFADIAATIAEALNIPYETKGISYFKSITQ